MSWRTVSERSRVRVAQTWPHQSQFAWANWVVRLFFIDTMDKWDDDKLKQVVEKKHGEGNKQKNKTDIVRMTRLCIPRVCWFSCSGAVLVMVLLVPDEYPLHGAFAPMSTLYMAHLVPDEYPLHGASFPRRVPPTWRVFSPKGTPYMAHLVPDEWPLNGASCPRRVPPKWRVLFPKSTPYMTRLVEDDYPLHDASCPWRVPPTWRILSPSTPYMARLIPEEYPLHGVSCPRWVPLYELWVCKLKNYKLLAFPVSSYNGVDLKQSRNISQITEYVIVIRKAWCWSF